MKKDLIVASFVDTVGITETLVRPDNTDFVMDDVTFHAAETPSLGLLALGLAGAAVTVRKKILG